MIVYGSFREHGGEGGTVPVSIAVVGCGFFGRYHLHAWRDLAPEGAEIVAVCDRDEAKAREAAEAFGIRRWYSDPGAMMAAEEIGLLDIATRMKTHRDLVTAAMVRRIPTVVQKPLAPRWEDCVAMADAARTAGVFLAVHENFRFQRPARRIRTILDAGELGDASWARIALRTGFDVYRNQPYFYDEERLVILDLGIHLLDLARFYLGEAVRVTAETQRRNPRVKAEDTATILLRHRSGAVCEVTCTYENRRSNDLDLLIEIECERGGVTLEADGTIVVATGGGLRREQPASPAIAWATPPFHVVQESVLATCRHMLDCVQAGREPETSVDDNLRTFALVEAAYDSAAAGNAVTPCL